MQYTTSNGIHVNISPDTRTALPSDIYAEWCQELGVPPDNSQLIKLDADDSSFLIRGNFPAIIPTYQSPGALGFSSEGSFELFSSPLIGNFQNKSISVPNVNRMYTADYGVPRLMLTFHPPYDSGSSGVIGQVTPTALLIKGKIIRGSNQSVLFAARFDFGKSFEIAFSSPSGSNVPVYAQEIDANNSDVKNQVLVGQISISSSQSLVLYADYAYGSLVGTVIDEAGNPAQRKVRAHSRSNGWVCGETTSEPDGAFIMPIIDGGKGPFYVIALDDDDAPDLNALIYDRIMIP